MKNNEGSSAVINQTRNFNIKHSCSPACEHGNRKLTSLW